jgi:acetyltransferase-like isoleucine patch superfamily enzyme
MQSVRDLKSCIEFLRYRMRFPGRAIAFGARISGNCILGDGVTIEADCRIADSKIGDNAFLRYGSSVARSTIGACVGLHQSVQLSDATIGAYSYIAERSVASNVTIGKFSSIGPELLCGYGTHPLTWVCTSPVFYSRRGQCGGSFVEKEHFEENLKTTIGNDVWIGARVFLRDGVNIGDGAIIGAGAVVIKDVAPYSVVGGVPAKLIRHRFVEHDIEQLSNIRWWDWPPKRLASACAAMRQQDVTALLEEANKVNEGTP